MFYPMTTSSNTINNNIDLILSLCYNLIVDNTGMYVISKEVK